ncbi:PDDEXK nuclease domain-containing protein [Flavobacterium aquicola]|uniref:Putative nuclease of restriction endonuclease-like (RecB) superfamily n=1 Tax=Flavobacterium aquicola TaxID=1682742 RepID=A0A3E0EUA3_9FLAO|nr:PDDEXK nuclease domain-containing protein [Flavobacterium aquicola]REH01792.1 putative nuclease of restriction endonuclease-like (RecB) superfamily [Flavobacterium aquicola]
MELQEHFAHITTLISKAKENAFHAVNKELVTLYWRIGEYVSQQVEKKAWGKSVVNDLSLFIKKSEPNITGFSPQNIWRMKQFFETYKDFAKLAPLVREITWTNNIIILPCNSAEEREFYIKMSIREKWTKTELQRQINSSCFERVMLANTKLAPMERVLSKEVTNTFKDTYVLDLLQLPEIHLEKDLRKAITQNITKFLLEFGRDFAFMGEEYPLQVGNQDFAIDLLFYNRNLNCMVAIELKIEKFKPEHLGQLNFYLEALDRDIRKPHEQPSIGILLCNGKDDIVVEYALSRTVSPTLVADYQTKLPSKELLQRKWKEILETLDLEKHN